jgi:hypothetical protein
VFMTLTYGSLGFAVVTTTYRTSHIDVLTAYVTMGSND